MLQNHEFLACSRPHVAVDVVDPKNMAIKQCILFQARTQGGGGGPGGPLAARNLGTLKFFLMKPFKRAILTRYYKIFSVIIK